MKKVLFMLLVLVVAAGCKKEGKQGAQGPQGVAGPDAKTFNFSLTFPAGSSYQEYSGITGYDAGDVVLTFVQYEELATVYWAQLPGIFGTMNLIPEFSDATGNMYINAFDINNGGSPFNTTTTINFKAVLIKSSGLIKHPDVDLSNYEEVKATFGLAD